jgi:hypothetical protein
MEMLMAALLDDFHPVLAIGTVPVPDTIVRSASAREQREQKDQPAR